MSFTDVLGRISEIQQQFTDLSTGVDAASSAGTSATSASGATATAGAATASDTPASSTGASTATEFADALAQAQQSGSGSDVLASLESALTSQSADSTGDALSADGGSGGTGLTGAGLTAATLTGASTPLPAAASAQLTSGQQQFASTLAGATGLNPGVVSAWVLAEESGGAAQSRQASDNNDWLNVGYTDAGTYGASDGVWSDPVSAADATAAWLKGQASIPGYGTASSGIQSILASVGQSPQAQISALQSSGWASSGYPQLSELYAQVSGA